MRKLLISSIVTWIMTGCATYDYNTTNCSNGGYAHCDTNQAREVIAHDGKRYAIRENLLFLTNNESITGTLASKEDVLAFALNNPEFVAMFDPATNVATIHRRVYDYSGRTGEALMGTAIVVVGTASIVALARSHETCYEKRIARYRNQRDQTHKKIWENDVMGVGSKQWTAEVNASNQAAIHELEKAFDCLN